MYIGEQLTNYTVLRNNSIIYVLLANPNTEIINKTVSVVCKYPEKITTNISDPANSEPFFTPSRTLQAIVPGPVKGLDNTNSSLIVSRYNPLSDKTNMDKLAIFLAVLARIVIFAGLISFLIGCQTACTHMMHNLQKIWIHIFVASLALPSLFKYALSGLRDIQNQTIAGASGWTMSIPSTVYFDTPTAY